MYSKINNLSISLYDLPSEISSEREVLFMAPHGENIYKRKDGRWEGRYIKGYDAEGKAKPGYVYGKTYKEAKEKLTFAKANTKAEKKVVSSDMTVSDWFDRWLERQKRIKRSSYTTYSSNINKHIKKKLGKIKLKMLTEEHIQKFVDELLCELAPKSVRSVFSILRLGLDEAYEKNFVSDVCRKTKLPKVKRKEVKVFTKQEQKKIENYIEKSEKMNDIGILICFYTGIRIGELCALTWENIDLKRGVISIENTLYRVKSEKGNKKTELKISTPKSESSVREIPLPKFLIAKFEAIKSGSGFLINKKGKFIEPNVYSRRYKKILAELDIPYRKYHSTRHTFATRALEIGMDVKTLSEILGHSSPTVTLNLYAHSLPEHKRKEMDRLGKLYNPSN